MKALKILLISLILAPITAAAGMPKVDREDFSQLIVEGIQSSKALSREIRKSLGVAPERQENKAIQHAINHKKIMVELGAVAQVTSPTTKFVRSRPINLDLEDQNERRLAEEFQQSGY